MKATHREMIHARCPVEPVWDYYEVEVIADQLVRVETVRAAVAAEAGKETYQEDLTQRLATAIGARVTTTGMHRTTRTTVTCEPA